MRTLPIISLLLACAPLVTSHQYRAFHNVFVPNGQFTVLNLTLNSTDDNSIGHIGVSLQNVRTLDLTPRTGCT
jgi:hypothetical protein